MANPPRRPWIAALLNLLGAPGLGQLYNGRPWKAAFFLIGLPVVGSALFLVVLAGPARPVDFLGAFAVLLALQAFSTVDAVLDARRVGTAAAPWYSRWWALAAAYAALLFVLPVWTLAVLRSTIEAFKMQAGSMETTMLAGDHVIADKTAYGFRLPYSSRTLFGPRTPERSDLIVFLYPEDRERMFIKRVIGLPGETVEVRARQVFIDERLLTEPYARFLRSEANQPWDDWGPQKVPTGQLFVLGDNRDNSKDSRWWGFVPVEDVRGKPKLVYFSIDERGGSGIRWDRIGHALR